MADENVANQDEQTEADAAAEAPAEDAAAPDSAAEEAAAEEAAAEETAADEAIADEGAVPASDDSSDFAADDVDDIEDKPKGGGKRRLIIYGSAGLAAVVVLAGASYFIFSGDGGHADNSHPTAQMESSDSPVPRVKLALPPKQKAGAPASTAAAHGLAPQHAMTPPASQGTDHGSASAMTAPAAVAAGAGHGSTATMVAPSAAMGQAPAGANATAAAAPAKAGAQGHDTLNQVGESVATPGAGVVVPATTAASYASIQAHYEPDPLPPVPDPALLQDAPGGPLPRVANDGRQAWQVYARPFQKTTTNTPNIAIVVTGLGLSAAATQAAIDRLPPDITLAFSPYTKGLQTWVISAREAGHEILLGLPMQPADFPRSDPGPYTLETDVAAPENVKRLRTVLQRAAGYVGVIDEMGSGFAQSEAALKPVLEELRQRGLLYIDSGGAHDSRAPEIAAQIGLPIAVSLAPLDATASAMTIDERLANLETEARRTGSAVAIADALPVTVAHIAKWSHDIAAKNLRLAPVSAVVNAPVQTAKNAPPAKPAAPKH